MVSQNITLIRIGVNDCMSQAVSLYNEWYKDTSISNKRSESQKQLHLAYSVLSMAGLNAAARLVNCIVVAVATPTEDTDAIMIPPDLINKAFQAVDGYLESLVRGKEDQPLLLYPVYSELMQACGEVSYHESDLFFPIINQKKFEIEPAKVKEISTTKLSQLRKQFQQALLQLFKDKEQISIEALEQMHTIIDVILGGQPRSEGRLFWTAAQHFIFLLKHDEIDYNDRVRRVFARIDQQLSHLIKSSDIISEQLLREILYFIVHACSSREEVIGFVEAAGICDKVNICNSGDRSKEHIQQIAHNIIHTLQAGWDRIANGEHDEISEFSQQLEHLQINTDKIDNVNLNALLREINSVTVLIKAAPDNLNEILFLEMATALLVLELVVQNFDQMDSDFTKHISVMSRRLSFALAGDVSISEAPELPGSEAMLSLKRQHMKRDLADTLSHNLHQIEQAMDNFFRAPDSNQGFSETYAHLDEMAALLIVFDDIEIYNVIHAIQHLKQQIKQLAEQPNEPAFEKAANLFCAIEAYLTMIDQTEVNFINILSAVGFDSDDIVVPIDDPSEDITEDITIVHPTIEQELDKEVAQTRKLYDSWRDKDDKRTRKKELKDNLESIHQGAMITGDEQLESLSSKALDALQSSTVKKVDPALEKSISVIAPLIPEPEEVVVADNQDEIDAEMQEIFLEEAEEVLQDIGNAVDVLAGDSVNLDAITQIRRGFHTLKGSSRMVGLTEFGGVAWQIEEMLNRVLTSFEQTTPDLMTVIKTAHALFVDWKGQLLEGGEEVDTASLLNVLEQFNHGEPLVQTNVHAEETTINRDVVEIATELAKEPVENTIMIGDVSISPALYKIFMGEASKLLDALQHQCEQLRKSAEHQPEPEFLWATHTLTGIAGTIKMFAIHEISHEYELLVKQLLELPEPLNSKQFIVLEDVNIALAEMVDAIREQKKPQQRSDLKNQLVEIRQTLGQVKSNTSQDGLEVEFNSDLHSLSLIEAKEPPVTSEEKSEVVVTGAAAEVPVAENHSIESSIISHDSVSDFERRKKRFDDDIDPELLEVFLEEAQELMPQIGKDLRDWREQPGDKTVSHSLKRLLHTIKGSARMAGAMALGEVVHDMETRVENTSYMNDIPVEWFDALESSYDRANQLLDKLQDTGHELSIVAPVAYSNGIDDHENSSSVVDTSAGIADAKKPLLSSTSIFHKSVVAEILAPQDTDITQNRAGSPDRKNETQAKRHLNLRVRSDVADRLVNQAGQVNIARTRAEDHLHTMKDTLATLTDNISAMRNQVREIEIQAETQLNAKLSVSEEDKASFDPLEFDRFTRLQELTRFLSENVNDVTEIQQTLSRELDQTISALAGQLRLGRELQQELMGVRMTPFSNITERLYRIARVNGKEAGKRINLDIQGAQVELDRVILDRITAPLEHLLRNAIAHGLEHSETRVQAGKTAIGEVKLEARKEGNEVVISLQDDGAGLDLENILQTAIKKGIIKADDTLSVQETCELIFVSGFSTATQVTQLAGRGVGMDVVRNEINGLGGRIEVNSTVGQGTEFTIYLPLTLNVTQAVMVQVGSQLFAVPSTMFVQIQQYSAEDVKELTEAGELRWLGEIYPYHYLPHLLGYSDSQPKLRRSNQLLLLRSGNNRIALLVDGLQGNREIAIKRLGSHMIHMPGITGATVLGNGEVVLILNPVQLALHQLNSPTINTEHQLEDSINSTNEAPLVMVVDDSLTVRKITGRLLIREGYRVITAKDGVEALEILNETIPDAMLVDVEMPRMDGFDLTRQIRSTPEYAAIPIIMITSRIADKHRRIAKNVGVNEFLGKPYQDDDVISHLARLIKSGKGNDMINEPVITDDISEQ